MNKLEELSQIKNNIDRLVIEETKLQGQLESLYTDLKKDYGFASLEKAQEHLDKKEKALKTNETKFENELKIFKDKYNDFLK